MSRPLVRALPAVMALGALIGCTDFEPRWKVTDFRVLAVAATDSAEEFVTGVPLISPDVELSALSLDDIPSLFRIVDNSIDFVIKLLVVDPAHPTGPFRLRARACPEIETRDCDDADPALVIEAVAPFEVDDPLDLYFVFRPDDDWLNAVLANDPFKGFGGLFIMLDIDVESPSGRLRATKTLSFNLAQLPALLGLPADTLRPNRNPKLCGARVVGVEPGPVVLHHRNHQGKCDISGPAPPADKVLYRAPFSVPAGAALTIRPLANTGSQGQLRSQEETYSVLTFPTRAGEPPGLRRLTERIGVDMFATGGKMKEARGATRSVFGLQTTPEFRWTAPTTPGPVTLWLVVRDSRGGVSWFDRTLEVIDAEQAPSE